MNKKHAEDLIALTNQCSECRKPSMEVACEKQFDGKKYYYLKCNKCGYTYED
jgi:hypothetical protein